MKNRANRGLMRIFLDNPQLIKFWFLRQAFWIILIGTILISALLLLLAQRGFITFKETLTPLAAIIGVFFASFTFLHYQHKASVEEFDRLDTKFDSDEIVNLRKEISEMGLTYPKENDYCELLLDFFEIIAFKTRYGLLDLDITYEMFGEWILKYWLHCKERVQVCRSRSKASNDTYRNLEWLIYKFCLRNPVAKEIPFRKKIRLLIAPLDYLRQQDIDRIQPVFEELNKEMDEFIEIESNL